MEGTFGASPRRRGDAARQSRAPPPSTVYSAYSVESYPFRGRKSRTNSGSAMASQQYRAARHAPFGLGELPGGDRHRDEAMRLEAPPRPRILRGADDRAIDREHICGRGLRRVHVEHFEAV